MWKPSPRVELFRKNRGLEQNWETLQHVNAEQKNVNQQRTVRRRAKSEEESKRVWCSSVKRACSRKKGGSNGPKQ